MTGRCCRPILFGNPVCKHCGHRHGTGYDCRLDSLKYGEREKALIQKLFRKKRRKDGKPRSASLTERQIERAEARATRVYERLIKSETGQRGSAASK